MAPTKAGRDGNNGEQGHKLHSLEWEIRSHSIKLRHKGARTLLSNIGEPSLYVPRAEVQPTEIDSLQRSALRESMHTQVVALSSVLLYLENSCMSQQSAARRAGP